MRCANLMPRNSDIQGKETEKHTHVPRDGKVKSAAAASTTGSHSKMKLCQN
jgi:hypothetical protein